MGQTSRHDIAFGTTKKSQFTYDDVSGTLTDGVQLGYIGAAQLTASTDGAAGTLITYDTSAPTAPGPHGHGRAIASPVMATGAPVAAGGLEPVSSGSIDSAVTISTRAFEVSSGASTGSGTVTFASSGGGTRQLESSVSFGGLVAEFGVPDHLDLRDIAFGSGTHVSFSEAANNLSGTLMVADGTRTANITPSASRLRPSSPQRVTVTAALSSEIPRRRRRPPHHA